MLRSELKEHPQLRYKQVFLASNHSPVGRKFAGKKRFIPARVFSSRFVAGPSKARFLPASWIACKNGFYQPSSPSFGAGVIDLLRKGAIQRGLALLFCGPRLCAVGDERSSGLNDVKP